MEEAKKSHGCLNVLRWTMAVLTLLLLGVIIVIGLPLAATSRTLTDRTAIKGWFVSSGIYQQAVDAISVVVTQLNFDPIITQIAVQAQDQNSGLRTMINELFPATFLEQSVNTMLDSTYDWLEGNTAQPTFTINLITNQAKLNQLVATTVQSNTGMPVPDMDALTLQANITGEQLLPNNSPTTNMIKNSYNEMLRIPLIILGLILIVTLLAVVWIPNIKRSLIIVGSILDVLALILLAGKFLLVAGLNYITTLLLNSLLAAQADLFQTTFGAVLEASYITIFDRAMRYSIALLLFGVGLIVVGLLLRLIPIKMSSKKVQ